MSAENPVKAHTYKKGLLCLRHFNLMSLVLLIGVQLHFETKRNAGNSTDVSAQQIKLLPRLNCVRRGSNGVGGVQLFTALIFSVAFLCVFMLLPIHHDFPSLSAGAARLAAVGGVVPAYEAAG